MELNEFDQQIKDKLNENNDLHLNEIESSKSFIWTNIQEELKPSVIVLKWYYLAAAVFLLFLGTSIVVYYTQQHHYNGMKLLSEQIQLLNKKYELQSTKLETKKLDFILLEKQLKEITQLRNESIEKSQPEAVTQYIIHRDTVFIKQVEYITEFVDTIDTHEVTSESIADKVNDTEKFNKLKNSTNKIYPNFRNTSLSKSEASTLKFKLNSFASNLNLK